MTSHFDQFPLHPAVLSGLHNLGFTTPTPVQTHAIPLVLDGRDGIVQAKTGSGKTLAFGLPILSLLEREKRPQALVLVPTRELAVQVCDSLEPLNEDLGLRIGAIYGGVGLKPQEDMLKRGLDVIVGTPGRLRDLLNRGSLDLGGIRILVLDEADQMLDMGFLPEMEFFISRLPAREQTLLFSATMPAAIEAIARRHMTKPELIKLTSAAEVTPTEIEHEFVRCAHEQRVDALIALLDEEDPERAIIFVRTRHETKRLATKLDRLAGLQAGYLNGDMSQNARNSMMSRFRSGELKYLIATDVAARGLDIDGLSHVFHFAVPTVVETYIHRSGRTGRAGNEGKTITLVTPDGEDDFAAIRKKITFVERPFDASALPERPAPEPQAPKGRGGQAPRELTGRVPAAAPRPIESDDAFAEEVAIPGLNDAPATSRRAPAPRQPEPRRSERKPEPVRHESPRQPEARPARTRARDTGTLTVDAPERAARKEGEPRRRRELPPSATNPTRDAGELLNVGQAEERLATGPLAPLPRHAVNFRKFKLALAPGHRQTRDAMHEWLAKRTGVARSAMRSIAIFPDHATVEVDERFSDRFLAGLKSGK